MPSVIFKEHDGTVHKVEANSGETLMEAAVNAMVPGILAECGGACACATCHVHVAEGWLSKLQPKDGMEDGMLLGAVAETNDTSRLACQITLEDGWDGFEVTLPESQI